MRDHQEKFQCFEQGEDEDEDEEGSTLGTPRREVCPPSIDVIEASPTRKLKKPPKDHYSHSVLFQAPRNSFAGFVPDSECDEVCNYFE